MFKLHPCHSNEEGSQVGAIFTVFSLLPCSSVQARNQMKTHCRVNIVHCMLVRDIARHVEEGFLVGQSFTVLRTFSLLSINPNEDTLESYHCIVILYGKLEWIYA